MTQARDLPPGYSIPSEQGRQDQIDNVRLGGAETAWGGHYGDIVFVAKQQKIAWFYRCKKAFDLATGSQHGAADDIIGTSRCGGGSNQDGGGTAAQQML